MSHYNPLARTGDSKDKVHAVSFARLYPTTPAQSHRYSRCPKVDLSYHTIQPGQFSCANEPEPSYLPEDWFMCVQPEGQAYFYNKRARVVTEANMHSPEQHSRIMAWIRAVNNVAHDQGLLLSENVELFLHPDEDDMDACGYYFVDHASRTEFWLECLSSEDVGIPATSSQAQLKWAFQEHYWMHVEYFPMHNNAVATSAIHELISILQHARGDHLTSSVGTFPYNATQCQDFLEILPGRTPGYMGAPLYDGYDLCFAARIWTQVARHRFLNFYGETYARLSRDQHMIELPPAQCPLVLRPVRPLLFNLPRSYVAELEKLWVDNLVYADPYKQFMTNCLSDWSSAVKGGFLMLGGHVVLVTYGFGSYGIGLSSIVLSATAVVSGMILSHYHRMPMNFDTADAADYLSQSNLGAVYGFHPLSFVYSVPKAFVGWSALLMILQTAVAGYTVAINSTDMFLQAFLGGLAAMATLIIFGVFVLMRRSFAVSSYENSPMMPRWIRSVLEILPIRKAGEYSQV